MSFQIKESLKNIFLIFLFILLVSFFSPLLTIAFIVLIFLSSYKYISNSWRIAFTTVYIYAYSLIIASRNVFVSDSDDLYSYYDVYNQLLHGKLDALYTYAGGIEIGLPFLYLIYSKIFGFLEPSYFIFVNTFAIGILYLLWLEKYGMQPFQKKEKALGIIVSLIFFSFFITSQLVRQEYATIFILFALTSKYKLKELFFVLIATLFHVTSLPIYLLSKGLLNYGKITLIILGIFLFIFTSNQQFMNELSILSSIDTISRLGSYGIQVDELKIDIFKLTIIIIISIFSFYTLFFNKRSEHLKQWIYFIVGYSIIYIALLPYYLASMRMALIFHGFLLGYLLFISLKNNKNILIVIVSLIFIYQFISMLKINRGSMSLWHQYNYFDSMPMYYFIN